MTFSLVEVFLCLGNTGNLDVYNNIWHGIEPSAVLEPVYHLKHM